MRLPSPRRCFSTSSRGRKQRLNIHGSEKGRAALSEDSLLEPRPPKNASFAQFSPRYRRAWLKIIAWSAAEGSSWSIPGRKGSSMRRRPAAEASGGMSWPTPLSGTTSRLKGRVVTSITGYTLCDIVKRMEADLLVVKAERNGSLSKHIWIGCIRRFSARLLLVREGLSRCHPRSARLHRLLRSRSAERNRPPLRRHKRGLAVKLLDLECSSCARRNPSGRGAGSFDASGALGERLRNGAEGATIHSQDPLQKGDGCGPFPVMDGTRIRKRVVLPIPFRLHKNLAHLKVPANGNHSSATVMMRQITCMQKCSPHFAIPTRSRRRRKSASAHRVTRRPFYR